MQREYQFSTALFAVVETTDSMQPWPILKRLFHQMLVAEIQVTHSVYQRGHPLPATGCEHNLYEGQVLTGLLQDAAAS
jgi:hypothetical protein